MPSSSKAAQAAAAAGLGPELSLLLLFFLLGSEPRQLWPAGSQSATEAGKQGTERGMAKGALGKQCATKAKQFERGVFSGGRQNVTFGNF